MQTPLTPRMFQQKTVKSTSSIRTPTTFWIKLWFSSNNCKTRGCKKTCPSLWKYSVVCNRVSRRWCKNLFLRYETKCTTVVKNMLGTGWSKMTWKVATFVRAVRDCGNRLLATPHRPGRCCPISCERADAKRLPRKSTLSSPATLQSLRKCTCPELRSFACTAQCSPQAVAVPGLNKPDWCNEREKFINRRVRDSYCDIHDWLAMSTVRASRQVAGVLSLQSPFAICCATNLTSTMGSFMSCSHLECTFGIDFTSPNNTKSNTLCACACDPWNALSSQRRDTVTHLIES